MSNKIIFRLAAFYVVMWIISFGHAANRPVDCDRSHVADPTWRAYSKNSCEDAAGAEALLHTMFWPFYWSAQAFRGDA